MSTGYPEGMPRADAFTLALPTELLVEVSVTNLEKVGELFDGVVSQPQELESALETFGVKASLDDISKGRVRKRVPAKTKRQRSA